MMTMTPPGSTTPESVDAGQDQIEAPPGNLAHTLGQEVFVERNDQRDVGD